MEFSVLINKMVIFSVLMLIGYVLARKGLVDSRFGKTASMLVLNVFLPATILNSVFIADMEMSAGDLARLMLILTLTLAIGFAVGALTAHILPIGKDPTRGGVFELLVALSNTMFIGMPVAQVLYGPVAVFYCALSCIPFNVYVYTYGVWLLKKGKGGGLRIRDIFSFPLASTILAVLIFLVKLPVPAAVRELSSALNGATLPMSLLVIGISMGSVSLADAFRNRALYLASFMRLLVIPVLTWAVIRLITPDSVLLMTCMLLAASPGPVMATVLAIQYNHDSVFAAEGVLQSTVLSIVTIPALIMILGG